MYLILNLVHKKIQISTRHAVPHFVAICLSLSQERSPVQYLNYDVGIIRSPVRPSSPNAPSLAKGITPFFTLNWSEKYSDFQAFQGGAYNSVERVEL